MERFDSWESRLVPDPVLIHSGILGMKHGRRRYQNEDGTWTPLGLKERRAREGFGESRKERKEAKKAARAQRKQEAKAIRAQRKEDAAAYRAKKLDERRKKNVKNLTDDELKSKIERLKLEQEYRSLNKNPTLELARNVVNGYFDSKNKKLEYEQKKAKLDIDSKNAAAKLLDAQTAYTNAHNAKKEILTGSKWMATRKEYLNAKDKHYTAKNNNTILGAFRSLATNTIKKDGEKFIREHENEPSMGTRAGKSYKKGKKFVSDLMEKAENKASVLANYMQISTNNAIDKLTTKKPTKLNAIGGRLKQ